MVCIRQRFGSLFPAYELAGYKPTRDLAFIAHNHTARRLRSAIVERLSSGIRERGQKIQRLSGGTRFVIDGETRVSVTVVQQRQSQQRNPRWLVKPSVGGEDIRIAALMDGHRERVRAYYLFPVGELTKEHMLAPLNSADIEVFRSDTLDRFFDLCARCKPELDRAPSLTDAAEESLKAGQPPKGPGREARRLMTRGIKTYSSAFLRVSAHMRAAFTRANKVHSRIRALRSTFERLLLDGRFVELLEAEGIHTVPSAVYPLDHFVARMDDERFRERARKSALDILSDERLNPRTRELLEKLATGWRIQAAELIVLAGDRTDYFARAVVAATPVRGHLDQKRRRPCGVRPAELKWMTAEREYMLLQSKQVLASFGRDALEVAVIEAFVRCLLVRPAVASWLAEHDGEALDLMINRRKQAATCTAPAS